MNEKILLASLLALALASAACAEVGVIQAPVGPEQDLITPLNVRDPSALVMGPMAYWKDGRSVDVAIEAPPAAASCPDASVKIESSEFAKDGPKAGLRAVSIPIGEDQLLDVRVGDRVDVTATFTAVVVGDKASERLTATILQNVRVLGVVRVASLRANGVLRLELNPIEAQLAPLAAEQAALSLERRAPGDVELHPMEMSSLRRLFK